MGITTKVIGATILGATITLGSMVYFNGGETIDDAIVTVQDQSNKILKFKQNEEALVNKITDLKLAKADLEQQLQDSNLSLEEMEALKEELRQIKLEIADYEEEAGNAVERINSLTEEVEAANAKTEELQQVLDQVETAEPMSSEELAEVLGEEMTPEVPEEPEEEYTELTFTKGINDRLEITEGIEFYYTSPNYKIQNATGKEITYQVEDGEIKTIRNGAWTVEGISGSSTQIIIVELDNGSKYRINAIER